MNTTPLTVQTLNRLPYAWKCQLAGQKWSWRVCHGFCRRSGWNASQLDWWPITNGPYAGLVLEIWHTNQLALRLGVYEPSVSRWVKAYLSDQFRQFGPQRVWDVGANIGLLSMLCARYGGGPVVAFEPLEENLARCRAHLDRNPEIGSKVRLVQTAVSDREGEIEFSTPGSTDQCQIRDDRIGLKWHVDAATVTVPTITLDSFAQECDEGPTFIKIDVEGAEALVLAGASDVLSTHRPTLLVEVHGPEIAERCRTILASHGYAIAVLSKRGPEKGAALPDYGHIVATIENRNLRAERPAYSGSARP